MSKFTLTSLLLTLIIASPVALANPHLTDTDLSGANLSNADLEVANLTKPLLNAINIRRAELNAANLTEASLESADPTKAKLRGAKGTNPTGAARQPLQRPRASVPAQPCAPSPARWHRFVAYFAASARGLSFAIKNIGRATSRLSVRISASST